jgi:hypothetical protein
MDAAVGNPKAYTQANTGHSQFATTERYIQVVDVPFPGAAERTEDRLFGSFRK